ncbi:hypothetical protein MKEN_01373200 [Mycena kentingensis (nom. inval.)]|nr:hypothetical protein MKEN_01373200 [Mycena kentingensis (nom. inval.)]
MPPQSSDSDSSSDSSAPGFQYEPLRASVLDVFEQLGAFQQDSGLVEWMFPEVHQERQLRPRVKLTEMFDDDEPAPEPEETPRKSRLASRLFGGMRSRSKSKTRSKSQTRPKKENKEPAPALSPAKKPKKPRSSPNLRKDAEAAATAGEAPAESESSPSAVGTPEGKRRMSIFQRKPHPPQVDPDLPRPSISDEEWQQITMTGSIADYDVANPFRGMEHPSAPATPLRRSNDSSPAQSPKGKRNGTFARLTNTFSRSTPTSPTRDHAALPASPPLPSSGPATPTAASASAPTPISAGTEHSNASTDTITLQPVSNRVPASNTNPAPSSGSTRSSHDRYSSPSVEIQQVPPADVNGIPFPSSPLRGSDYDYDSEDDVDYGEEEADEDGDEAHSEIHYPGNPTRSLSDISEGGSSTVSGSLKTGASKVEN